MSPLHGRIIVDANLARWRVFAPSWRLWLWVGYLFRRVVVARLPGRLVPFVGWSPGRRMRVTRGMPPVTTDVLTERVESDRVKVTRTRFERSVRSVMKGRSVR